ncbi:hypothetical protein AX16_001039 [Volvariella volvacea WC 439]|nr:hypothetical protein AX16_001039 [Volvariella volvacea WC 439]
MLALRNLCTRQNPVLPFIARFATRANNVPQEGMEGMEILVDALREQPSKLSVARASSSFTSATERQAQRNSAQTWKHFRPQSVMRPHEITYKSRERAARLPFRRPAVGPPSRTARYTDVFHQFNIDPLTLAQNPAILAEYLSEMGKIYGRNVTGLTFKSQRRIGKAIRRAKMMGIIPVLSAPRYRTYH